MSTEEETNLEKQLNQISEIVADVLLRITALERILMKREIIEQNEYLSALNEANNELIEQFKAVISKEQE